MDVEIPSRCTPEAGKPADEEALVKDVVGFTHPNLHRRVDPKQHSGEVQPREYTLGVYDSLHSYRTVETFYHDEESTTCEIP